MYLRLTMINPYQPILTHIKPYILAVVSPGPRHVRPRGGTQARRRRGAARLQGAPATRRGGIARTMVGPKLAILWISLVKNKEISPY